MPSVPELVADGIPIQAAYLFNQGQSQAGGLVLVRALFKPVEQFIGGRFCG